MTAKKELTFTGTGSEYFRIWIVNLFLTVITLGIYSAWAKVRETRYFYHHTQLAHTNFDYHANPISILKGRALVVLLLVFYNVAAQASPWAGAAMALVFWGAVPWLLWKSLQFKLYNSSYRGIRFGFRGSLWKAYKFFALLPLCSLLSAGLLLPFTQQRAKAFQHSESRFGTSYFSFHASVASFYKTYLSIFLIALAGLALLGYGLVHTGADIFLAMKTKPHAPISFVPLVAWGIAMGVWILLLRVVFKTRLQNLIWSHTQLGERRMSSAMQWQKLAFIMMTNAVAIILTLGLFVPFAKVRTLRYQIESLSLMSSDNFDDFVAATTAAISSTAEGATDLLNFDISL